MNPRLAWACRLEKSSISSVGTSANPRCKSTARVRTNGSAGAILTFPAEYLQPAAQWLALWYTCAEAGLAVQGKHQTVGRRTLHSPAASGACACVSAVLNPLAPFLATCTCRRTHTHTHTHVMKHLAATKLAISTFFAAPAFGSFVAGALNHPNVRAWPGAGTGKNNHPC